MSRKYDKDKNERNKKTKEGKETVIKEEIENHDKNSYCFTFTQPQSWGSGGVRGKEIQYKGKHFSFLYFCEFKMFTKFKK